MGNMWNILQTQEFKQWYEGLDIPAKESIYEKILVLQEFGPNLGRPYVDTLNGSRHKNMKELRVQNKNRPFRIFFAFTPNRDGILLIGGNKSGQKKFYETMILLADELYIKYLEDINDKK